MNEVTFLVKGSAVEPYMVSFVKHSGGRLTAKCSCPAGIFGTHCKHRLDILEGSQKGIVSDNAALVDTVVTWVSGSELEGELITFRELDRELQTIKRRLAKSKKVIAGLMSEKVSA